MQLDNKYFFALLVGLCFLLLSCDISDIEFWKKKPLIIAEVEDSRLSLPELKEIGGEDSVTKEEWAARVEFWVNFEVMYREALKRGLQKDPVVKRLVKNAERKILVDRLRLSLGYYDYLESDMEIREYYEDNKELFRIDSIVDTVGYIPFADVQNQIRNIVHTEKLLAKEKKWLNEIKNNYSIEVYPNLMDSL